MLILAKLNFHFDYFAPRTLFAEIKKKRRNKIGPFEKIKIQFD